MIEELIVKSKKTNLKKNSGITLISLVITIIILIILASVAIYLSLGNNGIFVKAKQAKEETNKQEATEKINLKITTAQMNKYAEKQEMPTLQELADILYEDNEIQYVALEKTVANKEKITVGENTSIFTKLIEYPYEFEINGQLQLASINGKSTLPNEQETSSVTTDELLIDNTYLVAPTTTTWTTYNMDFTIKPISNYKYLLFTYGNYNNDTKSILSISTSLIAVDNITYGTDAGYTILPADDGKNFSSATIYFLDDHTVRIIDTVSSGTNRKHFAITSIKGIK